MRGFTLLELIVSTAILSIILTVAIPSLVDISNSHRSNASVTQLRKVLIGARHLALSNSQKVTVCPQLNNVCNNNWQNPISVFIDSNDNAEIDTDEKLLLTASNSNNRGNWFTRNAATTNIAFNGRGHAFGSATTLLYCPTSGDNEYARQLVISFQGRIRSDRYLSNRGTPYASLGSFNCPP